MENQINYKEKIPPQFLYPNKKWFEDKNRPVPRSIEGLEDYQLIIKLGGLRHLLEEHGYKSVSYEVVSVSEHFSAVKCRIEFFNKQFSDIIPFESLASCNVAELPDGFQYHTLSFAENRAFARCIRAFLNINIVSDTELSRTILNKDDEKKEDLKKLSQDIEKKIEKSETSNTAEKPKKSLKTQKRDSNNTLFLTWEKHGGTEKFSDMKEFLRSSYLQWKDTIKDFDPKSVAKWNDWADVPSNVALEISGIISTLKKKE